MSRNGGIMASGLLVLGLMAGLALPADAQPPRKPHVKVVLKAVPTKARTKLRGRALHDAHRQPKSIKLGPAIFIDGVIHKPSVFIHVSRSALPNLGLMSELDTTRRFNRLLLGVPRRR